MSLEEDLLTADFGQCFEQMRHYDEAFRRTLEFVFGGFVAVLAGSLALLFEHGVTEKVTLSLGVLLTVAAVAGMVLVMYLARNRVYFAFVARYVNELRGLYLKKSPGGVKNEAGMYRDPTKPRIFDPGSVHSVSLYLLSSCNSVVLAMAAAAILASRTLAAGQAPYIPWGYSTLTFAIAFVAHLIVLVLYWSLKEKKKTAAGAVFGQDG